MSLTTKQHIAARVLLEGQTLTAAAAAAKVSVSTVHRWHDDKEFAELLYRGSEEAFSRAAFLLKIHAVAAVKRLIAEVESQEPLQVRINAADKLLSHAVRYIDAVEMKAKVAEIEAQIESIKNPPRPAPMALPVKPHVPKA